MYKPRLCHKRNLKIVVNREVFFKSEHHTNQSCAESLQKKIKVAITIKQSTLETDPDNLKPMTQTSA